MNSSQNGESRSEPTRITRPGKHTKNYGKSPCLMGKSTINEPFSIANCNKLPDGSLPYHPMKFTIVNHRKSPFS
jgi:hypothetical protein